MGFDSTGKVVLDHIYDQPDPREYFCTLSRLDYCVPQQAKPSFVRLLAELQQHRGLSCPTLVDIGCSYGVNGALLKCDLEIQDLYQRYTEATGLDRGAMLASDRRLVAQARPRLNVVGLDCAESALAYGKAAGFLDEALHVDYETRGPTATQRNLLSRADLIVSTGCVGYVTERTLGRVLDAAIERRPWMAHFVLRMFDFSKIEEELSDRGYETFRIEGLYRQRRFASRQEQQGVLDTLGARGIDPAGLEATGWFYAQLHLSCPHDETACSLWSQARRATH